MRIDPELCTACEMCLPYCPMGAIFMSDEGVAIIDRDKCVECGVCLRSAECPVDAFVQEELSWPRSMRAFFSDPLTVFSETRLAGRGTEEMKTNEVTGRFKSGEVGIGIELGRPGTGARFHDVERVAQAMALLGVRFEPRNPVTSLMTDRATGKINEEVLSEKVLSAIVEFSVPLAQVPEALARLEEVAREIDTVFSLNLISKVEPDGSVPVISIMSELNIPLSINGKSNVGLGRPLFQEG